MERNQEEVKAMLEGIFRELINIKEILEDLQYCADTEDVIVYINSAIKTLNEIL